MPKKDYTLPKKKNVIFNKGGWIFGFKTSKKGDWVGLANPLKMNPLQAVGLRPKPKGTIKSKSFIQEVLHL
jgi:hypothetical protein